MSVIKITQDQYIKLAESHSPPSPIAKNCVWAFLVGGAICALGEVLSAVYQNAGADEKLAGTLVSISLIALSVILTAMHIYDNVADKAGAGTLVPITGFANAVASPAIEFRSEGFILGLAAKMFIISGPVIVYGTLASALYGVCLMLWQMIAGKA